MCQQTTTDPCDLALEIETARLEQLAIASKAEPDSLDQLAHYLAVNLLRRIEQVHFARCRSCQDESLVRAGVAA